MFIKGFFFSLPIAYSNDYIYNDIKLPITCRSTLELEI